MIFLLTAFNLSMSHLLTTNTTTLFTVVTIVVKVVVEVNMVMIDEAVMVDALRWRWTR